MSHELTSSLRSRTATAVADPQLRSNVARAVDRFAGERLRALGDLHEADELRAAARLARADAISRLPELLTRLADNVLAAGGHVCWAADGAEANAYVASVAARTGARLIAKSKSMATEETHLNEHLEAQGWQVVETDLGEWIVQLAGERPSHIIAPALHRNRTQVADLFAATQGREPDGSTEPEDLVRFARGKLRPQFLAADLGITGVNLAVAETGSIVMVTNEGNGRLVTALPKVHIAVMGAERVVADWEQADLLLSLLARSATGQQLSAYTTVTTGPRKPGEHDGPDEFHLVILDNGRSQILGSDEAEVLHCIRCGSCLNVCPVYRQTGGHAYGGTYSGPIGAVLTPLMALEGARSSELSSATTLCGACEDACPVVIPLPELLLSLRRHRADDASAAARAGWAAWAATWSRPRAYRASTAMAGRVPIGPARVVPQAARWAQGRVLPTPAPRRFRDLWAERSVGPADSSARPGTADPRPLRGASGPESVPHVPQNVARPRDGTGS